MIPLALIVPVAPDVPPVTTSPTANTLLKSVNALYLILVVLVTDSITDVAPDVPPVIISPFKNGPFAAAAVNSISELVTLCFKYTFSTLLAHYTITNYSANLFMTSFVFN